MLAMRYRCSTGRILAGLLAVLLAVLSAFAPLPARAQATEPSSNGKLASVKVTGSAKYRSEEVAPATGLSPGATITKADLQNGADRLAQLGLFSDVRYRYGSDQSGVSAEYQVQDAPSFPVWFDNFPWFGDDELTARLKRDVPLFDGTAPQRGSLLHDMTNSLEALLATRGVRSTVSCTLAPAPVTDQQVLQFHVETFGVNIGGVEFGDALAKSDPGIRQRLADVVGRQYSRSLIELFEFEQVRPVYLTHAFLHVRFGAPSAKITGTGADARVTVTAPVEPGPTFAWGGVKWNGNSAILSAELNGLIETKTGDPADGMKTEKTWDSVREDYTRHGFLDVRLAAAPQFDDAAKRVTYNVTITEGPQYHMGKLVLTGLSIEGERRIRAAWGIPEGAIFNDSTYEDFAATGIKAAFTGLPFHYEKIGRFLQEDARTAKVDVLLDFQ
jgi:outer membrane protein assembly factor BamA